MREYYLQYPSNDPKAFLPTPKAHPPQALSDESGHEWRKRRAQREKREMETKREREIEKKGALLTYRYKSGGNASIVRQ